MSPDPLSCRGVSRLLAALALVTVSTTGWAATVTGTFVESRARMALAGVAVGLGSSLSALASVVTAEGIGQFLQRNPGSYGLFFVIAACIYPVAMLLIQVLSPRLAPHVMIST